MHYARCSYHMPFCWIFIEMCCWREVSVCSLENYQISPFNLWKTIFLSINFYFLIKEVFNQHISITISLCCLTLIFNAHFFAAFWINIKMDVIYFFVGSSTSSNPVIDLTATSEARWKSHLGQLIPCAKCKRTFNPDRVSVHERTCKGSRWIFRN